MKRDDDYLRDLLSDLEGEKGWRVELRHTMARKDTDEKRAYHVMLLCDAGYMTNVIENTYRMTSSGHDYLDAIRDDTIWANIKVATASVGGVTLGLLKDLGVSYLKQKILIETGMQL